MGQFYKVWRSSEIKVDSFTYKWEILKFEPLSDGDHTVSSNGNSVPVIIDRDEITIRVALMVGHSREVSVPGMGESLVTREKIARVTIVPDDGEAVLHFQSNVPQQIPDVLVEYHLQPPELFSLVGEKFGYNLT